MDKERGPRRNESPANSRQAVYRVDSTKRVRRFNESPVERAKRDVAEANQRRSWESYWRRQLEFDLYEIALATAEVDNIDRRVPSPFSISFAQARAMAAIHGSFCDCHPAPVYPPIRQQRGAA